MFFLFLSAASCTPRCPITSCQVRMLHAHGEHEFRGQPFWKKQNPRMGEKLPKMNSEKAARSNDKSKNKN
ncbi:hypothetical protein ACFSKU_11480 [Pontibacter silvestris]|uniref:Secreted protein n=2 Tax=Pontibacter silvestris TaxID=2305183 RepID=A0ABW4WZU9_9BACT